MVVVIILSPIGEASQEAMMGSAQRVVVARARAQRDAGRTALPRVPRLLASGF